MNIQFKILVLTVLTGTVIVASDGKHSMVTRKRARAAASQPVGSATQNQVPLPVGAAQQNQSLPAGPAEESAAKRRRLDIESRQSSEQQLRQAQDRLRQAQAEVAQAQLQVAQAQLAVALQSPDRNNGLFASMVPHAEHKVAQAEVAVVTQERPDMQAYAQRIGAQVFKEKWARREQLLAQHGWFD